MRRGSILTLLLLAIITTGFWLSGSASAETDWRDKVDAAVLTAARSGSAEFIVMFDSTVDLSAANGQTKAEKARIVYNALVAHADKTQAEARQFLDNSDATYESFWIANYMLVNGTVEIVEALASLDSVVHVAANPMVRNNLPTNEATREQSLLNPTWGISRTRTAEVWQTLGITGTGAVIAGADTGYKWDHPSLIDSYRGWDGAAATHDYNWHDAIHALTSGGSNPCGLDSAEPCDDFGHGTHTMGTMAGGDHSGTNIGVAPGADWISCRNMERGDGQPSTYLECFQWFLTPTDIAGNNPDPTKAPHVINNSWHCPTSEGCTSANFNLFDTAINNLRASGIVVVVSASNSGPSCSSVKTPPPIFEGSFTVGSIQSNGAISGFSSRGPVTIDESNRMKPDIVAPGSGVYSANLSAGGYGNSSGTSMAAPHIAGVVALMVSANPDLAGEVNAIEQILRDTAIPRTVTASQLCGSDTVTSVPNNTFGYGEVDAFAAVEAALDFGPTSAELSQTSTSTKQQLPMVIAIALFVLLIPSVWLLKR